MTQLILTSKVFIVVAMLLTQLLGAAPWVDAVCSIRITGSACSTLKMNVRDIIGATASSDDTTAVVTFGDQVGENGSMAQASFNLSVQGNSPYSVRVSKAAFAASNLTFHGEPVSDGRFIELVGNRVSGTGAGANAESTHFSPYVEHGMSLDQIVNGNVSEQSTLVASGGNPSKSGSLKSWDNCVLIGMNLRCRDGYTLKPQIPSKPAFFQTTLQFRIFPKRP